MKARITGLSDVGRVRSQNQDRLLVADLTLQKSLGGMAEPVHDFPVGAMLEVPVGPKGVLALVADGMGGAQSGEVASRMTANGVYEELVTNWTAEADSSADRFAGRLAQAVRDANARIYEASQTHAEYRGMGSTATVVGLLGRSLYLAQVGDSRAYLVRWGQATQLSKDQSMVEQLVRDGEISQYEAERSQHKNVLLQAMGSVRDVNVDLSTVPLEDGDTVVLCSDGLTNLVTDAEIAHAVETSSNISIACSELVAAANARGGSDNVTVLLVQVDGIDLSLQSLDPAAERPYPETGLGL